MVRNFYLIKFQYLGFRYHGWQKQPNLKTVQLMLDKTIKFVLGDIKFKTLAAGRTDAMVSVQESYFELFIDDFEILNFDEFLTDLNINLPQDIKALEIKTIDKSFNIIQHPKVKEYIYLFSHNAVNHPFAAPFVTSINAKLDIELMKKGAKLFEGSHNFKSYCYKPSEKTLFEREIIQSEIEVNKLFTANFFPSESYLFRVKGEGFMRNQIRLMMGTLIKLGKNQYTLDDIKNSLKPESNIVMGYIAPASGLILNQVKLKNH